MGDLTHSEVLEVSLARVKRDSADLQKSTSKFTLPSRKSNEIEGFAKHGSAIALHVGRRFQQDQNSAALTEAETIQAKVQISNRCLLNLVDT